MNEPFHRQLRLFRHEQGFTLIELLIVILIIGIIAAIAIPAFLNQRKVAADAALKSDMRNVATAVETWQAQNRKIAKEMEVGATNWNIVLRDEDAPFMGSVPISYTFSPAGFNAPEVSDGVAVGMTATQSIQGSLRGYCIVGNVRGGTYSIQPGAPSNRPNSLFYDSLAGGFLTHDNLSSDGSCRYYRN